MELAKTLHGYAQGSSAVAYTEGWQDELLGRKGTHVCVVSNRGNTLHSITRTMGVVSCVTLHGTQQHFIINRLRVSGVQEVSLVSTHQNVLLHAPITTHQATYAKFFT